MKIRNSKSVVHLSAWLLGTAGIAAHAGTLPPDPKNVLNRVATTLGPPSVPAGQASIAYWSFTLNGQYCVEPRVVVNSCGDPSAQPSWSSAFTLELVDSKGKPVTSGLSTLVIPSAIPVAIAAGAVPNGLFPSPPSLIRWCAASSTWPKWYLRGGNKTEAVQFKVNNKIPTGGVTPSPC